jgi:Glu-tRNA(Gln) amidotransferase subunit E-like FAD-binding protein
MTPEGSPLIALAQQGTEAANLVVAERSGGNPPWEPSIGNQDWARRARSECHTRFLRPKLDAHRMYAQIKLSYIRLECKHRIPMSLLYRILLQKLITSPEKTKQRNEPHLATGS